MTGALVFVVFIVLVIGAVALGAYYNKQRQRAFAAWAAQHGYEYATRDERYNDMPWGDPFGLGFGHAAPYSSSPS